MFGFEGKEITGKDGRWDKEINVNELKANYRETQTDYSKKKKCLAKVFGGNLFSFIFDIE